MIRPIHFSATTGTQNPCGFTSTQTSNYLRAQGHVVTASGPLFGSTGGHHFNHRELYGSFSSATGLVMGNPYDQINGTNIEILKQQQLMAQMQAQGVNVNDQGQLVRMIMASGDSGGYMGGSGGAGMTSAPYSQQANNEFAYHRTVAAIRPESAKVSTDLDAVTDLTSDMVDTYGAQEMQRSAILSDKLLSLIGQDSGGEFSEKLNDLVLVAKGLDPSEAAKQRGIWRRFLNFLGIKVETAAAQYKMLDAQMSSLTGELAGHSKRQDGRKRDLESLYQENSDSYMEIERLVKKGRDFLAKPPASPLAEVKSGMEAQQIADRQALAQRLEKRVTDLDVAMTLMLQTAPEIRIMQANAQALIDKFTMLTNLTIPAWKKQFALHVLQLEQRRSATVADAVDDATNDAFVKNASMLHDNTLQVAASGQRQIMDMSTVEHVQGEILRTVADVRQLNADASASRAQIAGKLEHIRDDLVRSVAGPMTQQQIENMVAPGIKAVTARHVDIDSPQLQEITK